MKNLINKSKICKIKKYNYKMKMLELKKVFNLVIKEINHWVQILMNRDREMNP